MKVRTREEIEREFDSFKKLYHYTSIESFKRIIQSKTLMFNRNDRVNDIIEGKRTRSFQSYYYTACFTFSDKESIPLWHIYAKKDQGVRFSVNNRNFFTGKMYYLNDSGKQCFNKELIGSEREKPLYGNIIRVPSGYVGVDDVCRVVVEYSDEKLLIDPTIVEDYGSLEIRKTNVFEMAGIKGTAWAYEDEARFFTTISGNQLEINSIFFELEDDFFNEMIITLNPFMSDEERKKTISELKKILLGYDVSFVDSKLLGKIRM